jgi:hypothetical protein
MRNRLSIKINLLMSFGKKITGVVDDKQIDKLMNCTNGLGVYEIIYDTLKVYHQISLIKIVIQTMKIYLVLNYILINILSSQ